MNSMTTSVRRHNSRFQTIGLSSLYIVELIKFRSDEPSLDEEMVNFGIEMILTDVTWELKARNGK